TAFSGFHTGCAAALPVATTVTTRSVTVRRHFRMSGFSQSGHERTHAFRAVESKQEASDLAGSLSSEAGQHERVEFLVQLVGRHDPVLNVLADGPTLPRAYRHDGAAAGLQIR